MNLVEEQKRYDNVPTRTAVCHLKLRKCELGEKKLAGFYVLVFYIQNSSKMQMEDFVQASLIVIKKLGSLRNTATNKSKVLKDIPHKF